MKSDNACYIIGHVSIETRKAVREVFGEHADTFDGMTWDVVLGEDVDLETWMLLKTAENLERFGRLVGQFGDGTFERRRSNFTARLVVNEVRVKVRATYIGAFDFGEARRIINAAAQQREAMSR
ncbi:hypothetical protein AB0K52_22380 [Glycomyces sp. NPDC049804]|uniref:hypothetical protein n=1 Tax=Glycomyces sp. NPDC049804 TaxID=3154363 RepID=UPI0034301242